MKKFIISALKRKKFQSPGSWDDNSNTALGKSFRSVHTMLRLDTPVEGFCNSMCPDLKDKENKARSEDRKNQGSAGAVKKKINWWLNI